MSEKPISDAENRELALKRNHVCSQIAIRL